MLEILRGIFYFKTITALINAFSGLDCRMYPQRIVLSSYDTTTWNI